MSAARTVILGRPASDGSPAEHRARVAPFERHAFEPAGQLGAWCLRCGRVRERGAHLPEGL